MQVEIFHGPHSVLKMGNLPMNMPISNVYVSLMRPICQISRPPCLDLPYRQELMWLESFHTELQLGCIVMGFNGYPYSHFDWQNREANLGREQSHTFEAQSSFCIIIASNPAYNSLRGVNFECISRGENANLHAFAALGNFKVDCAFVCSIKYIPFCFSSGWVRPWKAIPCSYFHYIHHLFLVMPLNSFRSIKIRFSGFGNNN